jgi:hypothetical protein
MRKTKCAHPSAASGTAPPNHQISLEKRWASPVSRLGLSLTRETMDLMLEVNSKSRGGLEILNEADECNLERSILALCTKKRFRPEP